MGVKILHDNVAGMILVDARASSCSQRFSSDDFQVLQCNGTAEFLVLDVLEAMRSFCQLLRLHFCMLLVCSTDLT